MTDLNNIKELIEKTTESNSKAIEMQINFYQDFTRRQSETLANLADKRISSLKIIAESANFEKAIEQNTTFEKQAKDLIEVLHNTNISAFEKFSTSLKSIYS